MERVQESREGGGLVGRVGIAESRWCVERSVSGHRHKVVRLLVSLGVSLGVAAAPASPERIDWLGICPANGRSATQQWHKQGLCCWPGER